MVHGCRSNLVDVMSGVLREVFGSAVVPLVRCGFPIVENNLYGYADNSTLVTVVPSPAEKVVVQSL